MCCYSIILMFHSQQFLPLPINCYVTRNDFDRSKKEALVFRSEGVSGVTSNVCSHHNWISFGKIYICVSIRLGR